MEKIKMNQETAKDMLHLAKNNLDAGLRYCDILSDHGKGMPKQEREKIIESAKNCLLEAQKNFKQAGFYGEAEEETINKEFAKLDKYRNLE